VKFVNEVRIAGKVTFVGEPVVLPSGSRVRTVRVSIRRLGSAGRSPVDAIEVGCWSSKTRRIASRLVVGDQVWVEGSLRRRFFRTAGGLGSRYEVEATRLSKDAPPDSWPTWES
jgi:single-strand DNA-binding protein